ncbi:MAG: sigma 54-interacting transcriptional regulator [Polyangiaceae bacterium]
MEVEDALGAPIWVHASGSKLEQVFLNLNPNALHAMPTGGTLSLSPCPAAPEGQTGIVVGDTGSGIPRDQLERVFEPFFSTKSEGHGTGLNPNVCLSVVQARRPDRDRQRGRPMDQGERSCPGDPGGGGGRCPSGVLVVDDEPGMLEVCADTFRKALSEVQVVTSVSGARAVELLKAEHFDLLVTDIRMPDVDGVQILRELKQHAPATAAIVLTAYPMVDTAVASMKLGAADYITKPFRPNDLLALARHLLEASRLGEENRLLQRQVERRHAFDDFVGKSPAMQRVYAAIERVAGSDVDVLILGETGTGKELVARSVHGRSARAKQRFVPVDCGAIPDNLFESELFGHERGAFTGADARNLGLLEYASSGTFFMDEIAELPSPVQAKLLRVLQERQVRRVGGRQLIDVDVRVIAATSRDLDQMVREKRFREDLYYRVNVARIELPPLRDRREDIPLLVTHFAERFAPEAVRGQVAVDPDVIEVLSRHDWPGNVRELLNVVRRALAGMRGTQLTVDDLPEDLVMRLGPSAAPAGDFFALREERMDAFEREYLGKVLEQCSGDVTRAAREAQLPRGTFYRLLKKHGLSPASFR